MLKCKNGFIHYISNIQLEEQEEKYSFHWRRALTLLVTGILFYVIYFADVPVWKYSNDNLWTSKNSKAPLIPSGALFTFKSSPYIFLPHNLSSSISMHSYKAYWKIIWKTSWHAMLSCSLSLLSSTLLNKAWNPAAEQCTYIIWRALKKCL